MSSRDLAVFSLLAIIFASSFAHAQSGLLGIERSLTIQMVPQYPQAGDTVALKVTSPVIDLSQSTIVWKKGGTILQQGVGADSASVTLGALGSETDIEVTSSDYETNASSLITIIPTELDLLVDTDAYVPPFYRGRPLPTVGTVVHLEAMPYFIRRGSLIPTGDITFAWKKNGEPMAGTSGRGRNSLTIPLVHLYGNDVVSVEAYTSDHLLSNRATVTLTPAKPLILLYQDHPLYGVLYHQGLSSPANLPDNEVTFTAVPYFAQADRADDTALTYEWSVNGQTIPPSVTRPSAVTINADNSSGAALLKLELTHKTNYFLNAQNSWDITLSSRSTSNSPFGNFAP